MKYTGRLSKGEKPDLNSCTPRMLTKHLGLSPALAREIVAFRKKKGDFDHIGQLWRIKKMTLPLFEFIVANYTVRQRPQIIRKRKATARSLGIRGKNGRPRLSKNSQAGWRSSMGPVQAMSPIGVMKSVSGNALTVTYRTAAPEKLAKDHIISPAVRKNDNKNALQKRSPKKIKKPSPDTQIKSEKAKWKTRVGDNEIKSGPTSPNKADEFRRFSGDKEVSFPKLESGGAGIFNIKKENKSKEIETRKRGRELDGSNHSSYEKHGSGNMKRLPENQSKRPDAEHASTSLSVDRVKSDHYKPSRHSSIEKWISDVKQTAMASVKSDSRKSESISRAGKHREAKSETDSSKHSSTPPSRTTSKGEAVASNTRSRGGLNKYEPRERSRESRSHAKKAKYREDIELRSRVRTGKTGKELPGQSSHERKRLSSDLDKIRTSRLHSVSGTTDVVVRRVENPKRQKIIDNRHDGDNLQHRHHSDKHRHGRHRSRSRDRSYDQRNLSCMIM